MTHGRLRTVVLVAILFAPETLRAQAPDDPLSRQLTVRLSNASVEQALRAIAASGAVRLSFSSDLLPVSTRVTIDHERTTVGDALHEVLRGTNLGTVVVGSGHIVILRAPLVSASVEAPTSMRDSSAPQAETRMTPQLMDRVLVMGTPAAGAPERELATAVHVLSSRRIKREHAATINDLFRATIPGIVAWDLGASGPIAQVGSVRGSSSFSANYLKTYLDGVELASPYMLFAIDPAVIEQIELIQGPQGSAMYGSDAISGVAHVITNKGTFGTGWKPRVEANVAGGIVETDFAEHPASTQHHSITARGGGSLASYGIATAISENGAYVAGGSAGSSTVVGATRTLAGPIMLETTVRASRVAFSAPVSPPLARVLGNRAVPLLARAAAGQVINEHTFGATAIYQPRDGWRHTLVAGYDRNYGALAPQRNPATVSDLLLGASEEDARRASVRYSTSLRIEPMAALSSTFTLGIEHSRLQRERSGPASVIGVAPGTRGMSLYVDTVENTGWLGQWKVDIARALYLTACIRGDRNSSFGEGYGTAWSPMAGASYVTSIEPVIVRWRAAYGKGIRSPPPSARRTLATAQFRQLANPQLAPEAQSGVEGGIDISANERLAISLTAFDQRAEGLIQHVIPNPRLAPTTIQQQNVGEISNRGGDADVSIDAGVASVEVGVAAVASEVRALAKTYSGDLRVGDRVPEVPSWSGHGAVSANVGSLRATAGLTYRGSWTGYDWVSYYSALALGAEPPASMRVYWARYPSTTRPYVMVSRRAGAKLDWFVRVDNLTNQQRDTRDNLQVTAGRTISAGLGMKLE